MSIAARVEQLAEKTLTHMGYDLVRVRLTGHQRPVLEVMIDRLDGEAISVDDCAEVSRCLSHILDAHDPIPQSYVLEVTSPGLERPLTKPAHFAKVVGEHVKVELQTPQDGQRRWMGVLSEVQPEGAVPETITLTVTTEATTASVSLPIAAILKAKVALPAAPVSPSKPSTQRKKA